MNPLRQVLELLLSGEFICHYSWPEWHRAMRRVEFADDVRVALKPLGRALGTLGDQEAPDTYFARYADLADPADRNAATVQLLIIRDQLRPCLEFIRLFSQVGRSDACLAPGELVSFAELLDAIEQHVTYKDQLRDLCGHEFFGRSKSAKDNKDRLGSVLKALADAGYLSKRSSESANYVATGKMGYVYMVLAWLAEYNKLSVETAGEGEAVGSGQEGLNL